MRRPAAAPAKPASAASARPAAAQPAAPSARPRPAAAPAAAAPARPASKVAGRARSVARDADDGEQHELHEHRQEETIDKSTKMGMIAAAVLTVIVVTVVMVVLGKKKDEEDKAREFNEKVETLYKKLTDLSTGDLANQQLIVQMATEQESTWRLHPTRVGDIQNLVVVARNKIEAGKATEEMMSAFTKLENDVRAADNATSEKLKSVRQQLTEFAPRMATAAPDLAARYEIARVNADKAYATKLLDEAKTMADNEPENRLTLTRYQRAEDEIKTMLDEAFRAKKSDLMAFYEPLYRRTIEQHDRLVTSQFTPEAQEKLPWIDCLSGAKANEWTASKAKGFSHRCEGGVLQLVGPDVGEKQEAVISVGDREQWRSLILDMEFTIEAGSGADLCLRLGKNVNANTLFQPLKTDRPQGPNLSVGKTYHAKIKLIGSSLIVQYVGDSGAENNAVVEIEWPKSRKGGIGLIVPPGSRLKFTKFLVRNLS